LFFESSGSYFFSFFNPRYLSKSLKIPYCQHEETEPISIKENAMEKIVMSEVGGVSSAHLKSFIERIERLEEEKAEIGEQIREVLAEAKGSGFDIKIIRQILKIRKLETQERLEQEELLDLYLTALGMNSQSSPEDFSEAA